MNKRLLILFDDDLARSWEPFTLTRPVGELLFGTMTLRARAEQVFGRECIGHIAPAHLAEFDEPGAAPVLESPPPPIGDRLYLLSRFVPDWPTSGSKVELTPGPLAGPDGSIVAWYAPDGAPGPSEDFFLELSATPTDSSRIAGVLLSRSWELVSRNAEQLTRDVEALHPHPMTPRLPTGAHHIGEHALVIDESAEIEPGTVFNTSSGPIWLDRSTSVRAFTRLAGPAYIGPGSSVLGGSIQAVSVGPVCKVRGELADSICLGYMNKQHDGHIGHAYLGRWVNLGAGTTNSDLKNNYGSIRIRTADGEVDTGELKLGSLIGDHVKTGIGLLLDTGTVIGAGSNLYGTTMPPKYVPPFSWGTGDQLVEFRLEKFLEVAERAMSRRQIELSQRMRAQLTRAWDEGRAGAGA